MTLRMLNRMTIQIALRLDDGLAESVRVAAEADGTNLSEWIRRAIRREAALATALRARAEEDARPLYTAEQEDALIASRRRRAAAAFEGER